MYTHAHLRYAESMARHGDADALFLALRQINPIGIRAAVPNARPRQANCYYSSSDAAVADRYEGLSRYQDVRSGKIDVEGGWRVYSSGAGIWLRILHQCLLGLRRGKTQLVVDPVLPKALDGLTVDTELDRRRVTVLYEIGKAGCGPRALMLNRTHLTFEREPNPYRTGGAVVSMELIADLLHPDANLLVVQLG
jgi:cellobiose phosphorylase